MITSASEVRDLWFSRCLFLIAPAIFSNYLYLITLSSGRAAISFLHPHDTHSYSTSDSKVSGVANVKALVPTKLYLQTQDTCQSSTVVFHHNYTRFIWLETPHISSVLTNHIYNINCVWFWFEVLQYRYCNSCVEGRNFQFFTWQKIMSLPVGSPVLTVIIGCIMDLLGVCNCLQMRCNVNHILSCSYSVSISMRNRLYADGHID